MNKLQKVIFICEDEVLILEGEEAGKWDRFVMSLSAVASVHGVKPDFSKLNWRVFKKVSEEK